MQVLYKDEEGFLAVMEVTKAAYIEDEELMEICGPEEDIAVAIDAKSAEKAIRELYANGKADLSAYEYQDRDFDDDDFDDDDDDDEEYDDDEDDEDDEDDLFDRMIDMDFRTLGKDGVIFRDDE